MKSPAARRRSPFVATALVVGALALVGTGYAAISNVQPAQAASPVASETQIEMGERLYLEACSSCHGMEAQGTANGPTLIGVGAAAVDFQVSTGRMPMAAPGAQAPSKDNVFSEEDIAAMAAYVASLAPGPAIPSAEQLAYEDANQAEGGELFRINCSQCHQAAGQGGALTQGKYAPGLMESSPKTIYEAMLTGPQNMPVFADTQLNPEEKKKIIHYIVGLQEAPSPGGLSLGRLGPVAEGLFLWVGVFAFLIAAAVWIGIKAR